jgi:hypothetical protein
MPLHGKTGAGVIGEEVPSGDDLGYKRGTKEWRQQLNKRHQWIEYNLRRGRSLEDMGITGEKEHGKALYSNIAAGNADWAVDAANRHWDKLDPANQTPAAIAYRKQQGVPEGMPLAQATALRDKNRASGVVSAAGEGGAAPATEDGAPADTAQWGTTVAQGQYTAPQHWGGWGNLYGTPQTTQPPMPQQTQTPAVNSMTAPPAAAPAGLNASSMRSPGMNPTIPQNTGFAGGGMNPIGTGGFGGTGVTNPLFRRRRPMGGGMPTPTVKGGGMPTVNSIS